VCDGLLIAFLILADDALSDLLGTKKSIMQRERERELRETSLEI
jgi:hypothetical protein